MDEVTLLKEYIAHLESALESSLALNKAQAKRKENTMALISPDQYERVCFTCGACTGRPWVGLTKKEFDFIYSQHDDYDAFARAIEAALKEKNGG